MNYKTIARHLMATCESLPGHYHVDIRTDNGTIKLYWALARLMVWDGDNAHLAHLATVDNVARALKNIEYKVVE